MTKIREILDSQPTSTEKPLDGHTKSVEPFGKEFRKAMQPIVGLQRLLNAFRAPIMQVPRFDFAVSRIFESHRQLANIFRRHDFGSLAAITQKLAKLQRHNEVLDQSGWLPHYSTPFELLDECGNDPVALDRQLLQFYEKSWPEVRQEIEARLAAYELDDEAIATFREALDAHEYGLYRCVCRVLLAEVERIARIELHDDKIKSISSQPQLRKLAGTLRISSTEPRGLRGLNLLRRLQSHLYDTVRHQTDLNRFKRDPVPNRHAALHGLVVYSSNQNSLNAIFMTDYIFQVVSALKKTANVQAAS